MALGRLSGRRLSREDEAIVRRVELHPNKLRALQAAVQRVGATSFADLGAVWVVEGGYTFHALELPGVQGGTLVDTGISDHVRRRAAHYNLRLIEANFGEAATAQEVGPVDVVILNDVLLHQVAPDWDEVLRNYAPFAKAFVIVQPQWTGGDSTVRMLDLGRDEYLANVPAEQIEIDFDALDAIHPKYQRPFRDIHEIWQWGITDRDLIETVTGLGYRLVYWENAGQWRTLERFDNVGYVFIRDE